MQRPSFFLQNGLDNFGTEISNSGMKLENCKILKLRIIWHVACTLILISYI